MKRITNLAKHGIDLRRGAEVVTAVNVTFKPSSRRGELRWAAVGVVNDETLSAIFEYRLEQHIDGWVWTHHFISLRRASRKERKWHGTSKS